MIKKVLFFYNSKRKKAEKFTLEAMRFVRNKKIKTECVCVSKNNKNYDLDADLAIAIGGDGTVLYSARHIVDRGMPLLAINAGGLGFLSAIEPKDFRDFFLSILKGKYKKIERFLLELDCNKNKKYLSLNDIVIRSYESRAFHLKVNYNNDLLSYYFGDGLIISTPTGSTAYNLAAMGPIITPDSSIISLTPICPHTLTHRPMALSAEGLLRIKFSRKNEDRLGIFISVDGQEKIELAKGEEIKIKKYSKTLSTIAPLDYSYFEMLREKLSWGMRR
jgi:NAD+ kinase